MAEHRKMVLSGFLAALSIAALITAPAATAFSTVDIANASVDLPSAARKLVRRLAGKDPRAAVRADAWVAWADEDDAVVTEFLSTGLAAAEQRAAETSAVDADFCRRVLATYTSEFAPEVHAAAQRALNGTDSDRALFARSGFAAAQQRDQAARDADGALARALVEDDRRYVRALAVGDPGPQVRAAAARASRPEATDADLVEFFAYGWATAAELDLEAHRLRDAEQEARWQAAIGALVTDAQEAEQAALDASADVAEQLRATAARAWQTAGNGTGPARTAWGEYQDIAAAQAANWHAIAAAAAAAASPNWHAVADMAGHADADWAAEQEWAAQQSAFWKALYDQALDGETRMRNPHS